MSNEVAPFEINDIAGMVYFLRGQRVMLSYDLSSLYGVDTKVLMQAVRRNIERFPDDFMFKLSYAQVGELRSQIVTLNVSPPQTSLPYAFTEQGVAMLSSVLRSQRAIEVNIAIMRAFVEMRRMIDGNRELAMKIDNLENKYNEQFKVVFVAIKQLMKQDEIPKCKIGFTNK